jgi:hypothetical protein
VCLKKLLRFLFVHGAPGRGSPEGKSGSLRPAGNRGSTMLMFTCPTCHKHLKAAEALAGKKLRCPACRQFVIVPEVVAAPDPIPPSLPPAPETLLAPTVEPPVILEKPAPATLSAAEATVVVVREVVAEGSETASIPHVPRPRVEEPVLPHVPSPSAPLPAAEESRTAYFAPGGYTACDPSAAPFQAPELRRRLGHAAAFATHKTPSHGAHEKHPAEAARESQP